MKIRSRGLRNKIYQLFCCAFLLLHVFLGVELHGHGFAQGTLIKAVDRDWWSIEYVCRLASKKNKPSVASYDLCLHCCVKQSVKSGMESETNCYFRIGFDDDQRHDILCTPTQEFYIPLFEQWVPAYTLKIGDALLGQNGQFVYITHVEFVEEPLKVYAIEVCDTHTFFVGYHFVLTHNVFVPVFVSLGLAGSFGSGAAVGGAAGGFFGPITFVGGIVVGGLIGIAMKAIYKNRILSYKTPEYDITLIKAYCQNIIHHAENKAQTKVTGCFVSDDDLNNPKTHVFPIVDSSVKQSSCIEITIVPMREQVSKSCDKHDELEISKVTGCFEPVELDEGLLCCNQEKSLTKDNTNVRYDGPKARNWKEFEKNCPIGQQHGKKFIPTGKQNPKDGSPLRKLSEDIPNTKMFKKDHIFALDKFHGGDHFEVWDKKGNWIGVANLDGSKNYKKSRAEKDFEGRNIKDII